MEETEDIQLGVPQFALAQGLVGELEQATKH